MYLWIYLALLAASIWTWVTIIDKIVVSKYIKNPFVLTIIPGIMSLGFAMIIFLFVPIHLTMNHAVLVSLLAGPIYILAVVFYFKALLIEEASRVVSLIFITPLFVLVLATAFLGEVFTLEKYFGIFLVIFGAILISLKRTNSKLPKLGKAFWFMIVTCLSFALINVLCKYVLSYLNYWNYFFWLNVGCFLASLCLLTVPQYRKPFILVINTASRKPIGAIILSRSLNFVALLSNIIAISIGFVSLVSAVNATQPLFTLIYVIILSVFIPKLLKEELKGSIISLKLVSIFLIILGVYFIS